MVDHTLEPGQLLGGEQMCVADIYMAMLISWSAEKDEMLSTHAKLSGAMDLILADAAIRTVFESNGLI